MILLKQSTAVDVSLGPFLDDTDGKTAETALTITQPDIRLKKNGGAWAQKNAAQTLTHEENGWYEVALDATDTNTLGCLLVAIAESGALPCWREFLVVPAEVYDAIVSGSGNGIRGDVRAWLGTAAATPTVAGVPEVDVTHVGGTAQTAGDIIGDTNDLQTKIGTPAGASLAADIAAIEAQTDDIGAAGAGLTAVPWNPAWDAEVQSEVADALDAAIPGVPTANSINERIKTMDDADIPAAVAGVQADTNDLQTRVPAALVGGRMDAIASVIGADALDAAALKTDAVTELVNALLAGVIEGAVTLKQSLQLSNAAAAGKLSGAGTTAIALRNLADTLDRIAATVDASGNRSAVVRTFE
jgi:hypothetical protein